jgi:hypothetical protein
MPLASNASLFDSDHERLLVCNAAIADQEECLRPTDSRINLQREHSG